MRVLSDDGDLKYESALVSQRIKSLLVAQLEEHNYHLQYNLRMRDCVVDAIQKWQLKHEPGERIIATTPH